MTWILILNLYVNSAGIAITSVNGFKSQTECEVAGKTWLSRSGGGIINSVYTCISQSK
jgi:hypothetical protein